MATALKMDIVTVQHASSVVGWYFHAGMIARVLDVSIHTLLYVYLRGADKDLHWYCLLYTSPSPRDGLLSRMPSSA